MIRLVLLGSALALAAVPPAPAFAQSRDAVTGKKCQSSEKKKKRNKLFGAVLGGVADAALGRAGVPTGIAGISLPVGSLLSDAIIGRLDCKEQVQAATATQEAVRGGVGTTAEWESQTRPGVKGSSTVTAEAARADGAACLTVTDVVIVGGEETTVPKTMCRAPGASGYTLAA